MMPPPQVGQVRLYEIDGLRGWAALSVMLFHIFCEVFGKLEPEFRSPFLAPFLDGAMDVAVFFVLSGDALSAAYWARQSRESVARLAVKRYFRLGVPIFASCLIVFVLMKTGLIFSHQAAVLVGREDWLGLFLHYNYSVVDLIKYTAFDVFFNQTASGSLNPFLWPMQVELLGSLLVFCYLLLDTHIRLKSVFLIFILVVCLGGNSFLACFVFGMICGHVRARGGFDWLRRQRTVQVLAIPAVVVAAILGSYFDLVTPQWCPPIIIASCALVFGVYASAALSRFFALPLSRWLGRISFPLYLVHFPVIASFTSGLIVLAHAHGVLGPAVIWCIALGSAVLSVLVAVLFLPVEALTARIGEAACRVIMQGDLTIGWATLFPPVRGSRRPDASARE